MEDSSYAWVNVECSLIKDTWHLKSFVTKVNLQLYIAYTVVWEIFNSKNILWMLHSYVPMKISNMKFYYHD